MSLLSSRKKVKKVLDKHKQKCYNSKCKGGEGLKIDKRKHYVLGLDTETANTQSDENGLIMDYVLPYDIGYSIMDTKENVYLERSFIVSEIFYGEKLLMESAYYAKKLPKYREDIRAGKRKVLNTYNIRKQMVKDMEMFGITEVFAHNAFFDLRALNNLQRWVTKSKYRYWFPYGTEIWDTMRMARDVIHKMPTYRKFCEENGYLATNGRLSTTAENLFRFISKDNSFDEEHTGLEDVRIEREIFWYCLKQHKPMRKGLFQKEFTGRKFLEEEVYIYEPFSD